MGICLFLVYHAKILQLFQFLSLWILTTAPIAKEISKWNYLLHWPNDKILADVWFLLWRRTHYRIISKWFILSPPTPHHLILFHFQGSYTTTSIPICYIMLWLNLVFAIDFIHSFCMQQQPYFKKNIHF